MEWIAAMRAAILESRNRTVLFAKEDYRLVQQNTAERSPFNFIRPGGYVPIIFEKHLTSCYDSVNRQKSSFTVDIHCEAAAIQVRTTKSRAAPEDISWWTRTDRREATN